MMSHECLILMRVALKWLFPFFVVVTTAPGVCYSYACVYECFWQANKGPGFCFNGK